MQRRSQLPGGCPKPRRHSQPREGRIKHSCRSNPDQSPVPSLPSQPQRNFATSMASPTTYDGCYVDANAIGDMLGIKEFRLTLIHPNSSHIPGIHFAYIPDNAYGGEGESPSPLKGLGWSSNPDPAIRWRAAGALHLQEECHC